MDFAALRENALLIVIAAMAINHLVMRVHALRGIAPVFWGLQLVNLAVGSGLILLGIPGFEDLPAVPWLISLLFFFRVVQNNNARQAWLIERVREERHGDEASVKAAFLEALRKGEEQDSGS